MSEKLTLQQLDSLLVDTGDLVHLGMEGQLYEDCLLCLVFLKRLSDTFEEEQEKVIQHYLSKGKSQADAEDLADDEDEYDTTFFVPERARWGHLKDLKHDIGSELNKALAEIGEHNRSIKDALSAFDFSRNYHHSDKHFERLIKGFSKFSFRSADVEFPGLISSFFEFLLTRFAESNLGRSRDFHTPREVSHLLVSLLDPQEGMSIYDPAVGTGGMLVTANNYLTDKGHNPETLSFYGQELNQHTWAICKMNMFLNEISSADIRLGNVLQDPKHVEGKKLNMFDRVLTHFPFSEKNWGRNLAQEDPYDRYKYGIPPDGSGDYAFIQHVVSTTSANGMCAVLAPRSILFRQSADQKIREGIVIDDLVECVIGLPSNLLHGMVIPTSIILLNKNKPKERKRKILFINAEQEFQRSKHKNKLGPDNIARVVQTFCSFEEIDQFSRVLTLGELRENGFNLNVNMYVSSFSGEDK